MAKQEARIGIYYGWTETEGYADEMDINLCVLAFLANPAVSARNVTSPPASPADGYACLVAATGATGAFIGMGNHFAVWNADKNGYIFIMPKDGQMAVVTSEGMWGTRIVYKGFAWSTGVALG